MNLQKKKKINKDSIRTCVICRKKFPKNELCRIVKDSMGRVFFDITKKTPGRGMSICANQLCLNRLTKKSINNALKTQIQDDDWQKIIENIQSQNS